MTGHSLSRGPAKSARKTGLDPSFVCFRNAQTFPYCALSLLSSTPLVTRIMWFGVSCFCFRPLTFFYRVTLPCVCSPITVPSDRPNHDT